MPAFSCGLHALPLSAVALCIHWGTAVAGANAAASQLPEPCVSTGPRTTAGPNCSGQAASAELEAMRFGLLQLKVEPLMGAPWPAGAALEGSMRLQPESSSLGKRQALPRSDTAEGCRTIIQIAIPLTAIVVGVMLLYRLRTIGMLCIYFGAQSGFSLYMKVVLSSAEVTEALRGVPAAFFVTAIQQAVAFAALFCTLAALSLTPWPYEMRRLQSFREVVAVLVFGLAFAVNIGLNNFSLSFLAMSVNLIIRSCLPLVTLGMQVVVAMFLPVSDGGKGLVRASEVILMITGVMCAGLATLAKGEGQSSSSGEAKHLIFGVLICLASDFGAGLNLVLANAMGKGMNLNAVDTTFYMALPAALFLTPAIFGPAHPVEWPGYENLTDRQVVEIAMSLRPQTMILIILSGLVAVGYNVLQYWLVQSLSATHAAFAGNFNKAAIVMLSIVLGLEGLPGGGWSVVMMLGVLGNIASFTAYSVLKISSSAPKAETASELASTAKNV